MSPEFEAALEAINSFWGEHNGQPRAPQPDPMRMIAQNPLYGPMSETTQGGRQPGREDSIREADPRAFRSPAQNAMLDYGPIPAQMAAGIAMQPVRAGQAVGNALSDPTLANVTDAGFQTGMALFQPGKALGALGAGYALAGAKDAGLEFTGEANAQAKKKQQTAAAPLPAAIENDPLDTGSRKRLTQLQQKLNGGEALNRAEREEQKSYLDTIAGASTAANTARVNAGDRAKQQEQEEYARAVSRAEAGRNDELSRVRRFSKTEFGKVYDKTGGALAVAGGLGAGALHRAATAGRGGFMNSLALPAIEGTGAAFTANNIPLAYDAFLTDPDNPEKAANALYARELPTGHPRKQEFADYAAAMPDKNPVREQAGREFYDELLPRLGISAVEGIPSALTGANASSVLGMLRGGRGQPASGQTGPGAGTRAEIPPRSVEPPGTTQAYRSYSEIPAQARNDARDGYISARTLNGGNIPQKAGADALRKSLSDNGVNVPITPARIKATNDAATALEQQLGRALTAQEYQQIWSRTTLGIGGVAAGTNALYGGQDE